MTRETVLPSPQRVTAGALWALIISALFTSGCVGRFQDRSATVLPYELSSRVAADEKSIATGDLDRDGRTDIVICNKKPFGHDEPDGARAAILLMNEGSTQLQNRTALSTDWYLPEKVNDCRAVIIAELTGDEWPDVVFVNTSGQQPRFYRNRGRSSPDGRWQGFVDETASRFPTIEPVYRREDGVAEPSRIMFCDGAAGDVDGDGDSDLYFGNYNPGRDGRTGDVLLINQGGTFVDETASRLGSWANSKFVSDVALHDMDLDGDLDIVKNNTKGDVYPYPRAGTSTWILYNDGTGDFSAGAPRRIPGGVPYMFAVGKINGDNYPDVYQVTDGIDSYALGPSFATKTDVSAISTGYVGGNVHMADLDGDGDLDVGVADVDTEFTWTCGSGPGAGGEDRHFTLLANVGDAAAERMGGHLQPAATKRGSDHWRERTFDFAFVDINNDGRLDIFMGLCRGYKALIWEGGSGSMDP